MEIRKYLVIFSLLFLSFPVLAYENDQTHPALSEQAVKLYNYNYQRKLTDYDLASIKRGSTEEDSGTRPIFHFFDPIYDRGMAGAQTSKKWAQDTVAQGGNVVGNILAGTVAPLFSGETDHSWERAIYEYVYGDKQRAFQSLGHILHLVQDATVPDHTRNDDHIPYFKSVADGRFDQSSPYEMYTIDRPDVTGIAQELIDKKQKPVIYYNLDSYFDTVANYSNNKFFSRDTINTNEYLNPIFKECKSYNSKEYGCNEDEIGEYRLVKFLVQLNLENNKSQTVFTIKDELNSVLNDYWSRLSRQAVQNSAGVIKLFFDSVEREKQTGTLAAKNKSLVAGAIDSAGNLLAAVGLKGVPENEPSILAVASTTEPQPEKGNDERQALLKKLAALETELKARQQALDPAADWPPLDGRCPKP